MLHIDIKGKKYIYIFFQILRINQRDGLVNRKVLRSHRKMRKEFQLIKPHLPSSTLT